jgi:hypothetical protein
VQGMKDIINSISGIDKGNRQILFKNFKSEEVNILKNSATKILIDIMQLES